MVPPRSHDLRTMAKRRADSTAFGGRSHWLTINPCRPSHHERKQKNSPYACGTRAQDPPKNAGGASLEAKNKQCVPVWIAIQYVQAFSTNGAIEWQLLTSCKERAPEAKFSAGSSSDSHPSGCAPHCSSKTAVR